MYFIFYKFILFFQVARRCWAGNNKAKETICRAMGENPLLNVTLPNNVTDRELLKTSLQ